jgi:hypothetical protein
MFLPWILFPILLRAFFRLVPLTIPITVKLMTQPVSVTLEAWVAFEGPVDSHGEIVGTGVVTE